LFAAHDTTGGDPPFSKKKKCVGVGVDSEDQGAGAGHIQVQVQKQPRRTAGPAALPLTTKAGRAAKARRPRVLQDTVWGLIQLRTFLWAIVDTDVFQRLRYLAQTGFLRFVVPGATHDRFSHSIGTAHLALTLMTNIAQAQPGLGLTDGEINTVVVAALCHDLGHGPGSHGFDRFMKVINPEWSHEHQSVALVQHLALHRGLVDVLAEACVDVHVACEMILGSKDKAPPGWKWRGPAPGREFLYDIVSNATSGMDVDKWDYLERDGMYLNIKGSFSCQRLLDQGRVVPGDKGAMKLAWPVSETTNVMNMFLARYNLHSQAFQHRVTRCIESMAMDGLLLLRDIEVPGTGVKLKDAYKDPEVFIKTTDWVLLMAMQGLHLPTTPDMVKGLQLFKRIQDRDLWPEAGHVMLTPTFAYHADDIVAELSSLAHGLSPSEFMLDMASINCGKGKYDPMPKVPFYEVTAMDARGECDLKLVDRTADYMRPMYFQRRVMRVFAKDAATIPVLLEAMETWAQGALGPHVVVESRPRRMCI
jgi:hypothetical protein